METHAKHLLVETKNLSKSFGSQKVLKSVNFKIKPGTVHALVGPNGAGKTTLIKLLVGLYEPTHGEVFINGINVVHHPLEAKQQFGYISDDPVAYGFLSGLEFLYLNGKLRGMPNDKIKQRVDEIITIFPLGEIVHQPMSQYSRGNRQKLSFLAAYMDKPHLMIIDEPIVGLDPTSIEIFGKTLMKYAHEEGGAVLFTTHILDFAKEFADHVTVMKHGELIADEDIKRGVDLEELYHLAR